MTSRQTLSRTLVELIFFVIKTAFQRLETLGNEVNIYSYIIKKVITLILVNGGALWCSGKASDSRSRDTGFDPH